MRRYILAGMFILCITGLLWVLGVVPDASGQSPNREVPIIVREGLQAYEDQGADAAVKAWTKGSPLAKNPEAVNQGNILKTTESLYGLYKAYQVTFVSVPSESTKLIYLVMNYETGPLFAKFVAFKGPEGWHIVNFKFQTDVDQAWPSFNSEWGGQAANLTRGSSLPKERTSSTAGAKLPADCSLPESSPRRLFASEDELKKRIVGQWLSCDSKGWWGIKGAKEPIGIEFTLDGHWFALLQDDSGAVVRGRGFDYEGTVGIINTSQMNGPGHYQVNVTYGGGGTIPVHPVFSDSPRKMRLNSGAGTITYVPAPAR